MTRKWWVSLYGVLLIAWCSLIWASMNDQAMQQQYTIPGYVLRGTVWQDSTSATFTSSWQTTAMPDSVVLTLYIPSATIEGAVDSLIVTYCRKSR